MMTSPASLISQANRTSLAGQTNRASLTVISPVNLTGTNPAGQTVTVTITVMGTTPVSMTHLTPVKAGIGIAVVTRATGVARRVTNC
jgi:hypothetical protein